MEERTKLRFTRRRARDSFRALMELGKIQEASVNFGYGLGRNMDFLEPMCRNILRAEKKTETVLEFERLRDQYVLRYCMKDKDGKPVVVAGQYLVHDSDYEGDVQKLRESERFNEAMDEYEKRVKEMEETLDSDDFAEDVEVFVMPWKYAPKTMPGNLTRYLSQFMIGEPPDPEVEEKQKEKERVSKERASK